MKSLEKYWVGIVIIFGLFMFIKPTICLFILGGLISYVSGSGFAFIRKINRIGITGTGKIIRYESDSEGSKMPIVEFITNSGELIQERPYIYSTSDLSKFRTYKKRINQSFPILYDPKNSKHFVFVNENKFNLFLTVIFGLLGIGMISLGICNLTGLVHLSFN
ncbi:DUF3592 domain-containing protein [Fluviicola taffensis]|uniref:DUF3592 domain-containing protein n=1 Tax=Fluviicola taffensis (strain DSM 16823 / NCIMB 13979 / RW262) TaxID=755732 RepID=F2IEM3_FLUTR|nr:DUF3592 domain-containing protein [Fluviicola taffensis]AEA44562.1 hypothetical protein Fluta_2578 [Fluviicola taffensis DSM 16823]